MVLEKLLITIANFVVFATIARQLGAESIGLFSLTQSILMIGLPIALFVNEQLLIRFTLDKSQSVQSIYKHAAVLKLVFASLTYLLSVFLAFYFYGSQIASFAAIFCLIHFLNFELIFFPYFRAHQKGKLVFLTKILVVIPFSIIKVGIVFLTEDLTFLFTTYAIEALCLGMIAFAIFHKQNATQGFLQQTLNRNYFSSMIKTSAPLIGSAIIIMLYSRVDQFMIKDMLGSEALGQYAVGVKLSEASTMLFAAYLASRFPALLRSRKDNLITYNDQIVWHLQMSFLLGFSVFLTMLIFARPVITLLFGAQFSEAAPVLVIHMLGAIFIYYGLICTQWLIAEKLEFQRLIRVIVGLIINIVLNLFWIEKYGIVGAASATVVSQVGSNVFFNAVSSHTRPFFKLEVESFNPIRLTKNIRLRLSK